MNEDKKEEYGMTDHSKASHCMWKVRGREKEGDGQSQAQHCWGSPGPLAQKRERETQEWREAWSKSWPAAVRVSEC